MESFDDMLLHFLCRLMYLTVIAHDGIGMGFVIFLLANLVVLSSIYILHKVIDMCTAVHHTLLHTITLAYIVIYMYAFISKML